MQTVEKSWHDNNLCALQVEVKACSGLLRQQRVRSVSINSIGMPRNPSYTDPTCLRGRTERLSLQLRLRHWGHGVTAAPTKWQLTFTRLVPW